MTWDLFDGPRGGDFDYFHRKLTAESIPPPGAPWSDIAEFALSFDAYGALGGTEPAVRIALEVNDRWQATGTLPDSLLELRVALFMLQRTVHWTTGSLPGPPGETPRMMKYAHALVEAIRDHVDDPGTK